MVDRLEHDLVFARVCEDRIAEVFYVEVFVNEDFHFVCILQRTRQYAFFGTDDEPMIHIVTEPKYRQRARTRRFKMYHAIITVRCQCFYYRTQVMDQRFTPR